MYSDVSNVSDVSDEEHRQELFSIEHILHIFFLPPNIRDEHQKQMICSAQNAFCMFFVFNRQNILENSCGNYKNKIGPVPFHQHTFYSPITEHILHIHRILSIFPDILQTIVYLSCSSLSFHNLRYMSWVYTVMIYP